MHSIHTFRKICAVISAFALTSLSAPAALAEQNPSPSTVSSNTTSGDPKSVLVMDLSDSMMTKDAGKGDTRLEAAKKAATGLIDSLPDSANMGMVVYGQQESSAPKNRVAGCKDVETISPVGPIDKSQLKERVSNFKAKGYTPIGNSLLKAAEELGTEGERSIVLVSDGHDTCAPPPVCEVAKKLAGEGYNLTIHTVGFHANRKAQKELECIADTTGGQFLSAENASDLAKSMKFLTTRNLVGYQPVGTPFEFAARPEDAKFLGEGRYRTKIKPEIAAQDTAPLYYKLAVPKNHNAIVTLKAIPQKSPDGTGHQDLDYRVENVSNTSSSKCQKFESFGLSNTKSHGSTFEALSAAAGILTLDPQTGSDPSCDQTQWVVDNCIKVDSTSAKGAHLNEEIDVEVEIQFEPQVMEKDRHDLPKGSIGISDNPPAKNPTFANPEEVNGGTNYANAPELQSDHSYRDSAVAGEMKYYKIPVEWGQKPIATVVGTKGQTERITSPRVIMTNPFYYELSGTKREQMVDHGRMIMPDRPIQFMNREADSGGKDHAFAGYYYVGVGASEYDKKSLKGTEQPYQLNVRLEGEASKGPSWRPSQEDGPTPSDQPILAEGEQSENGNGNSDGSETDKHKSDADTENTAKTSDSHTLIWLVSAGIVVLVIFIIGIAVSLKNRRPRG